jgi:hypothetical protein
VLVRLGQWERVDTVSELGIYGTFLRRGTSEVLLNEEVRETEGQRDTEIQRHRDTEAQRHRQRQREREREIDQQIDR